MSSLDYLDLCRLCLVKDRVSVPIFEGEGDVRQIFLKIAACLPVKVGREDKLPKKICDDCVYKVELFYQFWNTTANAEKQLLQWLGEVSLDEKQGYVTGAHNTSMMKPGQNSGENRLDGSVMQQQVNDQTSGMGMGMMDGMGMTMPIMIPNSGQQSQSQQPMTSVPMDTGGNAVQTVQAVPGPSAQIAQQKINPPTSQEEDEDESEEEDNSDDECDGDDGLPVKEESEDEPGNRTIEPTTFVNVSLACDEAGPSGLQQQKIGEMPEMVMPSTDGDPKSGISRCDSSKALLPIRRSLRIQRSRPRPEVTSNKSEESTNRQVGCSMTTPTASPLSIKVEREEEEEEEAEEDDEDEEICDDENDTILPFCEVKIRYDDDEAPCADEGDELVHLNDENDEDDVFGDYSCQKCNIYFTTWNMLKRHTKAVHEAIQCFKCKICLKVYNKALAFESHVVSEHGTGLDTTDDFLEKLTLYRVSRGTSFYTRVKRNHDAQRNNNASRVIISFEKKSNVLSCSQCDYKSPSKRSLAVHVAKHVENGKFACKTCGRSFKIRRELTYHIRFSHREQNHICDVCGRIYRGAKTLHNHRKFVHFGGKYECKVCGRLLASQKNLDSHVAKVHVEKRPAKEAKATENFVCDACGKVLSRSDKLRMHMRVHNGERPYVCAICKESFAKKNSLRQHLILHTGAKPYVCDICGKAFAQKPGLTGHRKSHPGEHPPLPPVYIDSILDDVLRQCEQ